VISAGIIDRDYTGSVGILMVNNGSQDFKVNLGDRIAQLILERIADEPVIIIQELTNMARGDGGFGSTEAKQINIIQEKTENNTKYSNPSRDRYGTDGLGDMGIDDNNPCHQIPDLCDKDDTRAHHAPHPLPTTASPPPSPPEPEPDRTPPPAPSRNASSSSSNAVLDPELGLSEKRCKDGRPPSSARHASLSASDHMTPRKRYDPTLPGTGMGSSDDEEERLTRSGRESGVEGGSLDPSWTEGSIAPRQQLHSPPKVGDSAPESSPAKTYNEEITPDANRCKGVQ